MSTEDELEMIHTQVARVGGILAGMLARRRLNIPALKVCAAELDQGNMKLNSFIKKHGQSVSQSGERW